MVPDRQKVRTDGRNGRTDRRTHRRHQNYIPLTVSGLTKLTDAMIYSQGQNDVISSMPNGDVLMPKPQRRLYLYSYKKCMKSFGAKASGRLHLVLHFIWVFTVCKNKKIFRQKNTIFFKNYNLTPLDMYNGLSQDQKEEAIGIQRVE